MRKVTIVATVCVTLSIISASATAAPGPVLDIRGLVDASDLIATATVIRVSDERPSTVLTPTGSIPGRELVATLQLDHVFKGSRGTGLIDVSFVRPERFVGYREIDEGTYRLVFLTETGGKHAFTSPYYPSLVAAPGDSISATEPLSATLEVLASTVASPNTLPVSKREAIHALWGSRNDTVTGALRLALNNTDESTRLTAAAALLNVNDLAAIAVAETALMDAGVEEESEILHNLRVGISEGVSDESALPNMGRLLGALDVRTRRAAVSALRRMRSQAAIPVLAKALDDVDSGVKHTVVRALSELTHRPEWGPNMIEFEADEQRYTDYWKNATKP